MFVFRKFLHSSKVALADFEEGNMTQNQGLLVDVDIEPPARLDVVSEERTSKVTLMEGGGGAAMEVNSNTEANKNIFDGIDTIQTCPQGGAGRHRERQHSVDSTNSIRSYDSTGNQILM